MEISSLVKMRDITKKFPGIVANDSVSFDVAPGEIHVLMGENGAGKTTLMSILSGFYKADEGDIFWKNKKADLRSPHHAIEMGIGMMHQHFRLVPSFTVTENIVLGLQYPRVKLDFKKVSARISELSKNFHLLVDPDVYVWQLSIGEKQKVEILKLLYKEVDLLILDEPTAVLTPQEVEHLWKVLKNIVNTGCSIVLITHKLREAMAIADRITVMRNGNRVATLQRTQTNEIELANLMVGEKLTACINEKPPSTGKIVLELKNLSAISDRGLIALNDISFSARAGEIIGVAGVSGNGQRELAQVITGLRSVKSGQIILSGVDITGRSPKKFMDASIAYIPEDRLGTGLCPGLNIMDNLILRRYRDEPFCKKWQLDIRQIINWSDELIDNFDIKVNDRKAPVSQLSGGNLQKVVLARETIGKPSLIVAAQPTRGLDVAATCNVQELLLAQRDRGAAIIMISEDLDEILRLSDRILVLYKGKIMGDIPRTAANREMIGLMMAGETPEISTSKNDLDQYHDLLNI